MNKTIAFIAVSLTLSACGTAPTVVETAREGPRDDVESSNNEAPEVTVANDAASGSGLGTIAYDENTRAKRCEKRRRTGSHIFSDGCEGPDSGSQPVRYGTFDELGRLVMSGSVRPEN